MSASEKYEYNILGERFTLPLFQAESETKEHILLSATLLFATRGYSSVSMRDIAETIGIKPASLYNHFNSKEALYHDVLHHAKDLYLLYFNHLDEALSQAETFEQVLDIIFQEPIKLANIFTCYAFSLIQAEQFRDDQAAEIFTNTIWKYSTDFLQGWFEKCITRRLAPRFDTRTVASVIMNGVMMGLNAKVQVCLGRRIADDPGETLANLRQFILAAIRGNRV